MILVCIFLFETLDGLREHFGLSLGDVFKIKYKLIDILERIDDQDVQMHQFNRKEMARKIAKSQAWAKATADDIIEFIVWIGNMIDAIRTILISTATGICRVLLRYTPGLSKTRAIFKQMYTILDTLVNADDDDLKDISRRSSKGPTYSFLNSIEDEHCKWIYSSHQNIHI